MKKIVKLTESDLMRIVKRVINEEKEEKDNMIKIPKRFRALRDELGAEATPNEIKKFWNKYVLPDTMGDTPKLSSFEDGKFVNAKGKSLPVSAILDELNYALSDDDEKDDL
jgi:5'(3')-deoxyribonucleotidase